MSEELTTTVSRNDSAKIDVIILALERIEQDLHKAKCEIKTAIRDVSLLQNGLYDLLLRLASILAILIRVSMESSYISSSRIHQLDAS